LPTPKLLFLIAEISLTKKAIYIEVSSRVYSDHSYKSYFSLVLTFDLAQGLINTNKASCNSKCLLRQNPLKVTGERQSVEKAITIVALLESNSLVN